jgi:hypothetical protein
MTVYNRTVASAEFLHSLPRTINVSCQMALSQIPVLQSARRSPISGSLIGEIKKPGYLRNVVAFGAGICLMGMLRLAASLGSMPPKSVFDNGEPRSPIQVTQPISHLLYVLGHWPWGVLLFLVFSFAAILKRREETSWTYALMAGVMVLGVLREAFLKL